MALTRLSLRPVFMGALMGPMMLWMLHAALMDGTTSPFAATAFVAAHAVVAGLVILSGLFAGRVSPRFRAWTARLHRPSLSHVTTMLGAAVIAAFCVHLIVHGGI